MSDPSSSASPTKALSSNSASAAVSPAAAGQAVAAAGNPAAAQAAAGFGTMSQLKEKSPEVYNKMMQGIAMNIVGKMRKDNENFKKAIKNQPRGWCHDTRWWTCSLFRISPG